MSYDLAQALVKRFSTNVDFDFTVAAFLFTYKDHILFHQLDELSKKLFHSSAIRGIISYINNRQLFTIETNTISQYFADYLHDFTIDQNEEFMRDSHAYYIHIYECGITNGINTPHFMLSQIAARILSMLCLTMP